MASRTVLVLPAALLIACPFQVDPTRVGCTEDAHCPSTLTCVVGDGTLGTCAAANADEPSPTPTPGSADSALGSVPCSEAGYDAYRFEVDAPTSIVVRVDTVSAAYTFDPALQVHVGADAEEPGALVANADDDFPCTYAPTSYSCPEAAFEVPSADSYLVYVMSIAASACADERGDYELSIDGLPANTKLALIDDDRVGLPPEAGERSR